MFNQNGYPFKLYDSIKQQQMDKTNNCIEDSSHQVGEPDDHKLVFKVPYLGKISIAFAKKLRNLLNTGGQQIRTLYKTTKVQDSFVLRTLYLKKSRQSWYINLHAGVILAPIILDSQIVLCARE